MADKNNPRAHWPQHNKKAVLTTASYFKISVPLSSERHNGKDVVFLLRTGESLDTTIF